MRLFLSIMFLFVVSCRAVKIVDDQGHEAANSNYPSAEFTACGERFHGLGACSILKDENPNKIDLKIQTYFSGSVRVYSTECEIDKVVNYQNSEMITVEMPNYINQSCLITMTVSPLYPNQAKQDISVSGMIGYFFLKVLLPDEKWVSVYNSFPKSGAKYINIPITGYADHGDTVRTVMISDLCGIHFDKVLPVDTGTVTLSTNDIGFFNDKCVVNGVFVTTTGKQYFTWMSWRYEEGFVPLAIPIVNIKGKKLTIVADISVTASSLDDTFVIGTKQAFDFDPSVDHVLRVMTVKGRTTIGLYKQGVWSWLQ